MTDTPTAGISTPDYTMGFSDEFLASPRRFTAETHAAYLLPYLKPGVRVLDFGCGIGTISAGLAEAVAPGEMHGVDLEESQIELARAEAERRGLDNATFHVSDVLALPFEDGFFDVAHGNTILMHIPDAQAALTEVKRVLKPGGIIACREMICASSFAHPDFGVLGRGWEMLEDILKANEGHPQMGKELKGRLAEAGFDSIQATASLSNYSSPSDVAFFHRLVDSWFLSPEMTETAVKYGAATEELCDELRMACDRWKDDPGAIGAIAHGQAIAVKPAR